MKPSVCALVSGGLDSCVMLALLTRQYRVVHPVFVRQGLTWEDAELRHLRRFLRAAHVRHRPLTILHLPADDLYGAHWSTTGRRVPGARTPDEAVYLPGRNLMLLSKAAVFCAVNDISAIAVGSLGHNPFPDATPKFFRHLAIVAGEALGFRLKIIAPFRSLTKEQVVRRGVRLKLPLRLSFSCISPRRGLHCGHCNKCAERRKAFRNAGVEDLTQYATAH
ncbi:MAG TPA: 7-cyano-7-deazaguanine synthase [Verrucomicrobiae bacterium]|nr:7-cyano-7-deazaguanine synthase [Verrucomicrobiae bacterium]